MGRRVRPVGVLAGVLIAVLARSSVRPAAAAAGPGTGTADTADRAQRRRSGADIGRLPAGRRWRWRRRIPALRLIRALRVLRRPAGSVPARGRAVVGLRRPVGRVPLVGEPFEPLEPFDPDASAAALLACAIAALNAGSGTGFGHSSPRSIASSPGVLIGGLSDGMRPPKSSNIVSRGRFLTSEKIASSSARCSVSFSSSSPASVSRMSRYSVSTSHASVCAASMSLRTSSSMIWATSWL